MEIAKTHQDQLERIKKDIKLTYEDEKHNYDRFNEFRRFIFETSLTQDDISLLTELSKPSIEFNTSESYISRLMGEFSKQEPSISVSSEDEDQFDPRTAHIVEQHIRHILMDTNNNHTKWEIMKDLYSGGFSSAKVFTRYANPMSVKQVIDYERVWDPCLVGYDQMARMSHKGDGRFCFELRAYELEEFKKDNPKIKTDKISFNRTFAGYNWSYLNGNKKIVMVAHYYEKKKRDVKIVELSNNQTVTIKEYEKMIEEWEIMGMIAQVPQIIGKPVWKQLETVVRYKCMETEIIEYTETDFTYFPLIYFDGNGIMLRNAKTSGAVQRMTRPYLYHAKGAQKLKNFAGITLANEIENIVQHKFLVAKEALPKEMDFLRAYEDVQKPSLLVFNSFFEQDPDKPIMNPIREVQRVPTPPEVMQTFTATDSLMQNILGSYDASLGINDNQLSGVAIVEAATQSNAAAMPYIVGFLQGLQRVAQFIVDVIPKYYTTPRTIPVMGIDGKATYQKINDEKDQRSIPLFYDANVLNVKVEAGVSFQIQKSRALQQLIVLQKASPLFAQFMNEKGLNVLLDNIEIRGIDQLKMMVNEWQQELAQQKQNAMQQQQEQMQNNPQIMRNNIEMAKLQQKGQETQGRQQMQQAQMQLDAEKLRQAQMKILSDTAIAKDHALTQRIKAEAERFAKQVDLALRKKDMHHRHFKESIEVHHNIHHANRKIDHEIIRGHEK
jgi:hypothetical protein